MRILVVEDEPTLRAQLGAALREAGYAVDEAADGRDALHLGSIETYDAVVLDLGLPDFDGKEAIAKARAFYDGPIIVLSARDKETEKIDTLDLGADDYVEKPFGVGELLARLRVALRHTLRTRGAEPLVQAGDLTIDLVKRLVTRSGQPIRLSPKEYDLLAQLVEGGGKVVTHRQLLTAVWGPAHVEDVQYLRVFIAQLRQKVEPDASAPSLIVTEPGVGYRWLG